MTDPLELVCRESGEGPPLVVLHGLFGSARNWQAIARQLAADWRVLALDLRNHGDSPWSETMTYAVMAADVLAFLDARGIARAAVLGHSMGGKVAMTLALTQPQRVAALVVADIAPVAYPPHHAELVAAMRTLDAVALSSRERAGAALAATVAEGGVRAFLLQNLVKNAAEGGFRWRLNLEVLGREMAAISAFPAADLDAAYQGPTCFIVGAESTYVQPAHRPVIQKLFPLARGHSLAGAGHWLHAERPEAFLRALRDFLAKL